MTTLNKKQSIPRAGSPVLEEGGAFMPEWYRFLAAKVTTIENIALDDATDAASVITLANANKAKINELLQSLRDSGILEV